MRITHRLVLAAGAIVLALGCAPTNPGLNVEGVLTPDAMCTVSASNAVRTEGTLDLSAHPARIAGISYTASFLVANDLINNSNRIYPLRADPDVINIDHVEVTLMDSSENTLSLPGAPNPYLVPASGTIASTSGTDPTLGLATATIITDAYGVLLGNVFTGTSGTLLVRARLMGTTTGGSQLTSAPIFYPINICRGCLIACTTDAMHMPINSPSCLPGQDAFSSICP